ncbi:MAG: hypothetical protein CL431_08190 [Acidimicrobiaceae bacterium]|jgi:protoporphyrinogen oxidase|nr:hypothetical protein [Acidimicrobiaceae bacterium]|tara:strand:+ start:13429 stop:14805 length:1377 start_codon:yes stop_codon:yes gene_type:complete
MTEIAIVGSGPAGLMAALRALELGHDVEVFEGAPSIGGMSGSFEINGLRVDYGSHRLHPSTPPHLLQRISELLGDDLQSRERNGRIRLYDRWVSFPLRTTNMIRHLPLSFSLHSGLDILKRPFEKRSDLTFEDEVTSRLGKTVASEFYSPYAEKLWGISADQLDGEQARRRVSASSPLAIIKRLVKSSTPAGRTFLYPKKGYGQIVEVIANAVIDQGGSIHLDSPVTEIRSESNTCQISAGEKSLTVEHVWSTAPLTKLTEIIQPKPDKGVLSAASSLRVRGMVLAYLILDQEQYTEYDAHYLPSQETRIARLSEPKNYRSGEDPEDFTILCAEIPCWVNDDVWESSDQKIGEIVISDIQKLGLPNPRYVETRTKRLPSVYPVFERETMNDREALLMWGESLGRIVPFGRQGFLVPDNLHHTLGMGWDLAESIGGRGEVDRVQWQSSINSFKENIVED